MEEEHLAEYITRDSMEVIVKKINDLEKRILFLEAVIQKVTGAFADNEVLQNSRKEIGIV